MNSLIIEELRSWMLPLVVWRHLRGRRVHYLTPRVGPRARRWLARLEHAGAITRLELREPLRRFNRFVADQAYQVTERVYAHYIEEDRVPAWMARRRHSEAVHLLYRKRLMMELVDYLDARALWAAVRRSLPEDAGSTWIPGDPMMAMGLTLPRVARQAALEISQEASAGEPLLRGVRLWGYAQAGMLQGLLAGGAVWCVVSGMIGALRSPPRSAPAEYGVGIINPLREFANDARWPGFFIDGQTIRPEQIVCVPLTNCSTLTAQHRETLRRRGVRIAAPTHRSLRYAQTAIADVAWYLLQAASGRTAICTMRATLDAIRAHWSWQSFLDVYPMKHFITYADFGPHHIARNIILHQRGVETWYYADSTNTPDQLFPARPVREFHWGYLYYDHVVTWGERHIRFLKRHHQQVGEYVSVGCLWSEHVRDILEGTRPSRIAVERPRRLDPRLSVLGVFDGSYHDASYAPYAVGVALAEHLWDLLEARTDVGVVFKPKKPFAVMAQRTGNKQQMETAYARLATHPRCWFMDFRASVAEVIAASDLVMGLAFGTPPLEALGARRRAIFYDPCNAFPESYYDRIPHLVAHSPTTLRELVAYWLAAESSTFEQWLERYVTPEVDAFLDGRGITRFRQCLVGDRVVRQATCSEAGVASLVGSS